MEWKFRALINGMGGGWISEGEMWVRQKVRSKIIR
jgi:hypothetical protein